MKGNFAFDAIIVMISIMILGMAVLLGQTIYTPTYLAANASGINMTGFAPVQQGLDSFNTAFVLIIIAFILGSVVSAFFISTHPVFFVVTFILTIILIMIAAIFTNVFDAFATSDAIASAANRFDLIVFTMRNLPAIMTILLVLTGIALYAKRRGGSGL